MSAFILKMKLESIILGQTCVFFLFSLSFSGPILTQFTSCLCGHSRLLHHRNLFLIFFVCPLLLYFEMSLCIYFCISFVSKFKKRKTIPKELQDSFISFLEQQELSATNAAGLIAQIKII